MKLYLPLRLLIARSCKSSLRERPADITQGWFNTLNTSAHFLVLKKKVHVSSFINYTQYFNRTTLFM